MRTFLTLIACGLALTATSLANLDEAHFRGHVDGYRYDIRITYKPMPAFGNYQDAPKVWTVIDSMQVAINDRAVRIPRSATADLFWPHNTPQPPFRGPNKTLRFTIAGADGEYSYDATFVFSGARLTRREKTTHGGKTTVIAFPREQHTRPR